MSRNYPPTTGGQTHLSKWCGWDPADGVEAILKKNPQNLHHSALRQIYLKPKYKESHHFCV